MNLHSARSGFMLVTVLVITAIGLLFGAGALLLFRFQCQLRIDRQHELEKVYAVRSALNYIRTATDITATGKSFRYYTESGRNLGLFVKPVEPIFPDVDMTFQDDPDRHFVMDRGDFKYDAADQFDDDFGYEYGVYGTNLVEESVVNGYNKNPHVENGEWVYGLYFGDVTATNGVKWWVNIGMRGTGGWLQEKYGRRYGFTPMHYVGLGYSGESSDIVRLAVIRDVFNEKEPGCRHGWPLSQKGEMALVFEIIPMGNSDTKNSIINLYEYKCQVEGATPDRELLLSLKNCPPCCPMGIQIADNKVAVFYVPQEGAGPDTLGYVLSEAKMLSKEAYDYFAEQITIGGTTYPGVTNENGVVRSPELRAVFEVEAVSSLRGKAEAINSSNFNFLKDFKVTPAYQYDVYLEHPSMVTNLATVAQKIGEWARGGSKYTILTYDTHGTDNKGFRKDEKLAEENKK